MSDEFAVPLCSIHHDALHRVADEREWWTRHGIRDPLQMAERLWVTWREQKRTSGVIDVASEDEGIEEEKEPRSSSGAAE